MWSVKQYRSIGRDVEQDWRKRHTNNQPGNTSPVSSGPRSEDLDSAAGVNNDKILVKKAHEDDPIDPRNWPLISRCKNIAILALLVFVQGWAGSADSIANSKISQEFGVSKVAENLSQALYAFGIGTGCLFVGPLSETLGRNPTYLVATFCYLFFVLGTALSPNYASQMVCRYFVGLFASATLGINGASVQDQFRPVKRAFVFPIIAWANVAGPSFPQTVASDISLTRYIAPMTAPVAGGWIITNPNLGWRWCHWITLIISSVAFVIAFLFLPETYLPVLLEWKAKHLRRVTGNQQYISEHDQKDSFFQRLKKVLPMPITYFGTEPIIAVLGGYMILIYILLFSFLSGFDYIFKKTYNLSDGLTGSCFASIAAGSTFFTLGAPGLYDWTRFKTKYISGASIKPEFRLWPAIATSAFLPISLFWLGWTNYASISPWSGLAACFVFGIVVTAVYVSTYEYIIDSYAEHGAVALASITMARYMIAGGMIIAARPMYNGIGVHWTMTFLGCIATILVPAPWVLHNYGTKLRSKSQFALHPES
jgi:DHA1 family multidrug resistance protein-like MFS transporter